MYDPNGPSPWTSRQTLGTVPGPGLTDYRIGLQPETSPQRYTAALSRRLGPGIEVHLASEGTAASATATLALVRALTELIMALAGLGALSPVLIATRERVHDLEIFKSLRERNDRCQKYLFVRQILMAFCGNYQAATPRLPTTTLH